MSTTLFGRANPDNPPFLQIGGALLAERGQVIIDGAELRGNTTEFFGGGIYMSPDSTVHLREIFFKNNVAEEDPETNDLSTSQLSCGISSCSAGSYGNCTVVEGPSPCASCVLGDCTACPPGRASRLDGATGPDECIACETGFFSELAAAHHCANMCDAGHYVTDHPDDTDGFGVTVGGTHCNRCPAGRIAATEGQGSCEACTPGRSSEPGATACSSCPRGTYSDTSAGTCRSCQNGTYAANMSTVACAFCQPGTHSTAGASSCTRCEPGKISGTGAPECTSCGDGGSSNDERTRCKLCAAGTQGNGETCVSCALGRYNPADGGTCQQW